MDPLASISSMAAGWASLNLAGLAAAIGAAGQDPTPATLAAQAQGDTQALASIGVLKKILDLESTDGAQLAQMVAGGVDTYA
jgi:hypothetical protein